MADGGVYRAWERFLNGLSNKPKSHKFLSLVFPQKGWRFCNTRDVGQGKNKKRGARLYLSKIGFFALILHREFPENQVCQMCVKVYASGRSYIIFLVEEAGVEEQSSKEPVKAVGVELGIARLATLSDGRVLQNPKPLEALLKESGCFRASRKRFLSKNWLKTKTCERTRTLKGFQARLFKLGALLSQEYDFLVLEDLNVQDLIQKSENKKRRMRLYDFSFSEIRAVLEWQFVKTGKLVLPVPAYNSSRKCFLCGEINENFERIFNCPHCGFAINRDLNACFKKRWVPPVVV